jgi:high-affinity iron transporter
MLLAAGVVTWMLFWMRRQAATVKGALQAAVDRALVVGGWGLALLSFTAVIREGVETSLFLVGQATSAATAGGSSSAASIVVGAVVGLAIAVLIGYGLYRGSRRLNLAVFFRWTGIAAGLLSNAVHEFTEIGALGNGPWTNVAFDLGGILSQDDGIGSFLRAIFGYSANPEILTLVVHVGYVVGILWLYLRPIARPVPPAPMTAPASRA